MHEYSIVQSLLTSCEEHAQNNNAQKVTKVIVKIGVLSGVEPALLQTAFDTFKKKTICDGCLFVINVQKVLIFCKDCEKQSILEKNEFSCKSCNSVNINVLDGEDMYLMSLELE